MIRGLIKLLNMREMPQGGPASREVTRRFRIGNDPVAAFIRAHCLIRPGAQAEKQDLLENYQRFLASNGFNADTVGAWFFRSLFDRWTQLAEVRPRGPGGDRRRFVSGIEMGHLMRGIAKLSGNARTTRSARVCLGAGLGSLPEFSLR